CRNGKLGQCLSSIMVVQIRQHSSYIAPSVVQRFRQEVLLVIPLRSPLPTDWCWREASPLLLPMLLHGGVQGEERHRIIRASQPFLRLAQQSDEHSRQPGGIGAD